MAGRETSIRRVPGERDGAVAHADEDNFLYHINKGLE